MPTHKGKKMQTVQDQAEERMERLNKIYKKSGMAQESMSQEMGVNRQTINNWLTGRTMPKSRLQIDAIDRFILKYLSYLK